MSQDIFANINPSATSGNQLATLLNGFKDAVASGFSGTSRPPNLQAGGYWVDTTLAASPDFLWRIKVYTGTVDITVFTLDISNNLMSIAGTTGSFNITKQSADAVGAILGLIKKRIANNGQTLTNDVLGEVNFYTTDNTGAQIISARVKSVSQNNTTSSQAGAYIVIEGIDQNSGTLLEKLRIIGGNFGFGTTTPSGRVHSKVSSGVGVYNENESDSTTGSVVVYKKKRISGNGQVLSGDSLFLKKINSTDNTGADIDSAFSVEAVAVETHTSTAHGTRVDFKVKKSGAIVSTTKMQMGDVLNLPDGHQTKDETIGTNGTASTNVKLRRSGTAKLQFVPANDVTAEGAEATSLATTSVRMEQYTNAGKPSFGNAGRQIYLTDQKTVLVDTGTSWQVAGGSGGSSVVWVDGVNPPFPAVDAALNPVRNYLAADTQNVLAQIKVPSGFGGGQQIKLAILAAAGNSTGTYLLQSVATLIRSGTDAVTSTTNQRTSTNTALTAANQVYKSIVLDLTDSSGNINGVAVSANDLILVSLKRGTDTSTADVSFLEKNTELVIG
jgi:hypothetical protein